MRTSIALAVLAILSLTGEAHCQYYQSNFNQTRPQRLPAYRPPTVTPFVNLLNTNGTNPAVLYQGIIRPQLQANQFQQFQQSQIAEINNDIRQNQRLTSDAMKLQQGEISQLQGFIRAKEKETGHRTGFMSRGTYFPRLNK